MAVGTKPYKVRRARWQEPDAVTYDPEGWTTTTRVDDPENPIQRWGNKVSPIPLPAPPKRRAKVEDKKPWESYESDDPKVKAEKDRTKKLKAGGLKLAPPPTPKPATATSAWTQARKFQNRNKLVSQGTQHLRPGGSKEDFTLEKQGPEEK